MVLEATMIYIDNSEWMRNGDYPPTRLQALSDAVNLICGAKTQSNPENTVGLLTTAGKGVRVLVTPTSDLGKILACMHGTPADCVSIALSGALFSWSKPSLVISGLNKGSSCGQHIFYSGAVAGAREALICGVPSLSISLNWKKDESCESDFKDAVDVCLPLIHAAIRDI